MKRLAGFCCALALWAGAVRAHAPVTLTIGSDTNGPSIPADFIGVSFGMKALPGHTDGAHLFSATNKSLVTLFRNVGLRHMRVGGTTVEFPPSTPIPNENDIDNLLGFADAAGVNKIIYSFRLLETNANCHYDATNAALARYIWSHYRNRLECFAIGNEPDLQRVFKADYVIRNFQTYIDKWRKFAAAITAAVPEASFIGPDAGSGNTGWPARFAKAEKESGLVQEVDMHYYAGGKGRGVPAEEGIETMLSPEWPANYEKMHQKLAAIGLPYRFTEANDHYSGGITNASDTFAGALWALDFLHWWAAHGARGVDFHNTQWVVSDIVTPKDEGGFRINPKGYGLRMFDLGAHGRVTSLSIANPEQCNLTAYAVRDANALFVTVINKDFGTNARTADVTITAPNSSQGTEAIFLTTPKNDVTAKTGVTLGGAGITDEGPWRGKWTPLPGLKIAVPPASAAVVKIETR